MSLIGKKFYWDTKENNSTFPNDIRILKEYDKFILTTKFKKIDKDILFKYYTMIIPELVFSIRFLINNNIRKSLIITVNSYDEEKTIYYEYLDILNSYLEFYLDRDIKSHFNCNYKEGVNLLYEDHSLKIQKESYYSERRFVVYGYKEDKFKDFFHFIPRKKWIDIFKNVLDIINSVYNWNVKYSDNQFYKFIKLLLKDNSKFIEVDHVLNIIPERYFNIKQSILNILISLRFSNKQSIFELNDDEKKVLYLLDTYNHGKYQNIIFQQSNIDLKSIRVMLYSYKTSLKLLEFNNPKDKIVLIRLNNNDIYIVLYRYKPIINQLLSNESALNKDELLTFLSKKTN